jgi:hypothetical protein
MMCKHHVNIVVVQPKYAQLRYKDMAGSKNKEFQFQHCFSLLQHLPKWKLRDNEPKCKKEAMLSMDDEGEDMSTRNKDKPEGFKKANERMKVEGEAASFKEKLGQLESRTIVLKEAKAMKELLAEERAIMMMRTDDMDEDQLAWWKETKADIMVRKMLACQARAASAPRGESLASAGGAGDGIIDG